MHEAITVSNLTKRFGELEAVVGISFDVAQGEIFAFLGPNGAGKTTTIKMLTTLLAPTSGEIAILGKDPAIDPDAVRHSFGIVFQDPSLDDELTAWENLEFHGVLYNVPKHLRRKRVDDLLELVELADRRDSLVREFSGGMKRRLEIARALIHHPKILFLDEPTIGLDPQTRNHLWSYVHKLNKDEGITVFLTTHYMEEAAKMAGRIGIIDHGSIVAMGTLRGLLSQTAKESLEEAFLELTGKTIRAEDASAGDQLKKWHQMRHGAHRR